MKTVSLSLSETEAGALVGLIDAGVRATGLRAVNDAASLLAKIEKAFEEAKQNIAAVPSPQLERNANDAN